MKDIIQITGVDVNVIDTRSQVTTTIGPASPAEPIPGDKQMVQPPELIREGTITLNGLFYN